jgi:hypothetical protein
MPDVSIDVGRTEPIAVERGGYRQQKVFLAFGNVVVSIHAEVVATLVAALLALEGKEVAS